MKTTANIYVRKDRTKSNGETPISLLIISNRKKRCFSLSTSVKPENWDFKRDCVKKGDPLNFHKNKLISESLNRAGRIILDIESSDFPFTFDEFFTRYKKHSDEMLTVKQFIYSEIEEHLKATRKKATIDEYYKQLRKIEKFKPNLLFHEIDLTFIKKFDAFMHSDLGNCKNTANNTHKTLKAFINMAISKRIIKKNPYEGNFKINRIVGNRNYLKKGELEKVYFVYKNGNLKENQRNVLKYFLFSCNTGLRYQDIKDLRYEDIQDNMIRIKMHKTEEYVSIPLNNKAQEILNMNRYSKGLVFKVYTNQPTNRHLKTVMKEAGINKNITFHCGRHSFATIGLSLGMSIHTIQKILGHKDIKTTMIYTHIDEDMLTSEMRKWDET